MYASDVAQVNDRVTRLVGLLRERGLLIDEDPLHPAVMEIETSAEVAAFARGQLAYTRAGRERIAARLKRGELLTVEEARLLLRSEGEDDASQEATASGGLVETNVTEDAGGSAEVEAQPSPAESDAAPAEPAEEASEPVTSRTGGRRRSG